MYHVEEMSSPFTVNDRVMFKLSEAGQTVAQAIIAEEQAEFKLKKPRTFDMDDWNEMPFWEFSNLFGPKLHHGGDNLFDELELITIH